MQCIITPTTTLHQGTLHHTTRNFMRDISRDNLIMRASFSIVRWAETTRESALQPPHPAPHAIACTTWTRSTHGPKKHTPSDSLPPRSMGRKRPATDHTLHPAPCSPRRAHTPHTPSTSTAHRRLSRRPELTAARRATPRLRSDATSPERRHVTPSREPWW